MTESDSLLLLDVNSSHEKLQVPAKLFDYVRVGRPILAITPPGSPSQNILERSGVQHTFVDPADAPEDIDKKLLEFLALPTAPVNPSPWFCQQFDGRRQTAVLAGVFDALLDRKTRDTYV